MYLDLDPSTNLVYTSVNTRWSERSITQATRFSAGRSPCPGLRDTESLVHGINTRKELANLKRKMRVHNIPEFSVANSVP